MVTSASPDPPPVTMLNMVPIKLDSTTYLMWRRQIIHMAECFDLMGLLDGSDVAPSPTITFEVGIVSPNPSFTTWHAHDKKLLSVMYTSVTAEATSKVIECSTSQLRGLP